MARKHNGSGGTPETKLGHRVAPAATTVLAILAEIRQTPENSVIEGLIRLGYDHLPASQREAISVILRAKGQSIRDLRPLAGLSDSGDQANVDSAGDTFPAGAPSTVRINRIGEIARKANAPIDAALDGITES